MRLLPHTWEGLHPAYPVDSRPSETCISVDTPLSCVPLYAPYGTVIGVSSLVCVITSRLMKHTVSPYPSLPERNLRSRAVTLAIKATVLVTAASGLSRLDHALKERQFAHVFLRSCHIEPPKASLVDQLDHWDQDNFSVSGAALGLAIASRGLKPHLLSDLSRPMWYAVHGIAGIYIANLAYDAREISTRRWKDYTDDQQKAKAMIQKFSYTPEIGRELVLSKLGADSSRTWAQVTRGIITLRIISSLRDRRMPVSPLEQQARQLEEMIRCMEEDRKATRRVYEEAMERSKSSDSNSGTK